LKGNVPGERVDDALASGSTSQGVRAAGAGDAGAVIGARRGTLHARVWRWHFFAGLFVAPLGIVLALSGSVYLFKPQIEAAIAASIHADAVLGPSLSVESLVTRALAEAGPGATLAKVTLPHDEADPSVEVHVAAADGAAVLWMERATGRVLARRDPAREPMQIAKKLHGELLGGMWGSAVVELAACWMIVLIVTGLYLAWPRRGFARALWPKLRRATAWRSLHAAAGLWLSGALLVFLLSGLPWTGVFGRGFDWVSAAIGAADPAPPARSGAASAPGSGPDGLHPWHEEHAAPTAIASAAPASGAIAAPAGGVGLDAIAARAAAMRLVPPVEIVPPRADGGVFTVQSMTARRPDRVTVHYDRWSGAELSRVDFADRSALQQAVSYGIALHEGALFGPLNQLFGVVVAGGVVMMCVTGLVMWWRRRPSGGFRAGLGAPALPADRRLAGGVIAVIAVLGAVLPLVGASLVCALALDWIASRAASSPHSASR
jgi:uncharacterized iron-regulated membrane protein